MDRLVNMEFVATDRKGYLGGGEQLISILLVTEFSILNSSFCLC